MNKTTRINLIMRYINNRSQFTLKELMQEFDISRSTAIRYVRTIEDLGLPLVSEPGRNGGYVVMRNQVLPAIHFTTDEIKMMFIAFMATRNQQLPYLTSRRTVTEKLLGLIPITQQDDLLVLSQQLVFDGTHPQNPNLLDRADLPDPVLEALIQQLLISQCMQITDNHGQTYQIAVTHLYHEQSQWWLEFIKLDTTTLVQLPLAKITGVAAAQNDLDSQTIADKLKAATPKPNVVLQLGATAVSRFKRYHPFSLSLAYTDPYQMQGILRHYLPSTTDEIAFFGDWLQFLGEDVTVVQIPAALRDYLKRRYN
ncbi:MULTISPECIES: helix-turn-helix transcriptional regulator [Lactiplantibacillus]|jgi:predicted DNA-binding transcriptional regulator YafY|uniref:HTH domain-containing protein n=1 Tax=Lactiplantibacillus pentosus TaxID=1589 RepID=A0AAW8W8V1_LACPE|nr:MULTISPECIES: HTH domain-containing protein [Lactiplantibacillus]AYG38488.1 HTH domain-containing protein [Lactiplantibacillus pentosus]AYG41148.1 HTH domain-containing protein [Lactiplantibacillus pentosus]MBU7461805.1 HTH domain-containing protein [Lactiplantibacillus pentosus]MBU7477136.1 HTH domain-containing protein [Lactiplantibacillus pentosus]MBU7484422.1 HTH domain-containing protein [Lactiplantibacillus sp. 30.2.29]